MVMLKEGSNGSGGALDAGERLRASGIPLALIGVGLAWLLASESGSKKPAPEAAEGGAGEVLPAPGAEASANGADENGAAESGLKTMARNAGERIADYAGIAGEGASRAGGEVLAAIERHPFLFGAIGLFSGAALATLLPLGKGEKDAKAPPSTSG